MSKFKAAVSHRERLIEELRADRKLARAYLIRRSRTMIRAWLLAALRTVVEARGMARVAEAAGIDAADGSDDGNAELHCARQQSPSTSQMYLKCNMA